MDLRPGERVDDMGRGGLRIIQHPGRFPFAMDPVLLAHFVRIRPHDHILDLGTGSGVIPLLLAGLYPNTKITGLEIQPDTADMAARSVTMNGLENQIRIDCGDYRHISTLYGFGRYDVVTMNPPYRELERGNVSADEARAVSRHEVESRLPESLQAASTVLKYGGRVAVVFLAERLGDLIVHLRACHLEPKRLRFVHPRTGKVANLLLIEAVKGGGVGVKVESPLTVYQEGQTYTTEMLRIYNS